MADNTITGRAKKFDGTAIDYVSIFNWSDGTCIAQVIPDAAGNWQYIYNTNIRVGLTYVADGCEPITHGAYDFVKTVTNSISGYLIVIYVGYGAGFVQPQMDVSNTSHPDWTANFSKVLDVGLFDYRGHGSPGSKTIPRTEKVINDFSIDWRLELLVYGTANYEDQGLSLEILDVNDNVLFAMRTAIAGSPANNVYYGTSLSSTQKITQTTNNKANGLITFTGSSVNFLNYDTAEPDAQIHYAVDLSSAVKVRVGGNANRHFNGDFSQSGGYIKILPN